MVIMRITTINAFVLQGLLAFLVSCSSFVGMAQDWCFQGSADMRMFISGRTQEQGTVYFTMNTSDCKWLVRFIRDEGPNPVYAPDYSEASFDGTAVYYLRNIKSSVEKQRKLGPEQNPPNIAYGQAHKGQTIYLRMGAEAISPVWLAYASTCYLESRSNSFIEPGMVFDGSSVFYGPPKHRQLRSEWTFSESLPRLPVRVVYFSDGDVYSPDGEKIRRPVPY